MNILLKNAFVTNNLVKKEVIVFDNELKEETKVNVYLKEATVADSARDADSIQDSYISFVSNKISTRILDEKGRAIFTKSQIDGEENSISHELAEQLLSIIKDFDEENKKKLKKKKK